MPYIKVYTKTYDIEKLLDEQFSTPTLRQHLEEKTYLRFEKALSPRDDEYEMESHVDASEGAVVVTVIRAG